MKKGAITVFGSNYVAAHWDPEQKFYRSQAEVWIQFFEYDRTVILAAIFYGENYYYFPATVNPDNGILRLYIYACGSIPENLRISLGVEGNCIVSDKSTLLRAFSGLDISELTWVEFKLLIPD